MYNPFKKYRIVKASDYIDAKTSGKERLKLLVENSSLKAELTMVRSQLESHRQQKVVIGGEVGDPTPKDRAGRRMYVAKVAGLHKDVLEPKLKHMIQTAHVLLEETGNPEKYDDTLKGAVYSFRELLRWGESMVNEQIANQIEDSKMTNEENKIY